jgi:hypothetical protein
LPPCSSSASPCTTPPEASASSARWATSVPSWRWLGLAGLIGGGPGLPRLGDRLTTSRASRWSWPSTRWPAARILYGDRRGVAGDAPIRSTRARDSSCSAAAGFITRRDHRHGRRVRAAAEPPHPAPPATAGPSCLARDRRFRRPALSARPGRAPLAFPHHRGVTRSLADCHTGALVAPTDDRMDVRASLRLAVDVRHAARSRGRRLSASDRTERVHPVRPPLRAGLARARDDLDDAQRLGGRPRRGSRSATGWRTRDRARHTRPPTDHEATTGSSAPSPACRVR